MHHFHALQNRAQTIGGSHISKKCDSPGGLVHTFSRVLPLGFYALWYFFGALALEVLQKKKLTTPLMRECHFLAKVCKTPVGTSKKRMLLPLEFYALLIFWCFFLFCVLKFMFPRVRFGLPAAILTQNAFTSKTSSKKMSFPSALYSKKCFLALPRVWGPF